MNESKIIPSRYMTISDMAKDLSLSKRTIYSIKEKHNLPSVKIGRLLYFDPVKVKEALGID